MLQLILILILFFITGLIESWKFKPVAAPENIFINYENYHIWRMGQMASAVLLIPAQIIMSFDWWTACSLLFIVPAANCFYTRTFAWVSFKSFNAELPPLNIPGKSYKRWPVLIDWLVVALGSFIAFEIVVWL